MSTFVEIWINSFTVVAFLIYGRHRKWNYSCKIYSAVSNVQSSGLYYKIQPIRDTT